MGTARVGCEANTNIARLAGAQGERARPVQNRERGIDAVERDRAREEASARIPDQRASLGRFAERDVAEVEAIGAQLAERGE